MLKRQEARGLTISFCEDIKSYKKIIPSICEFPEDWIITVDDDIVYSHDHLESLVENYINDPNYIHCYRAHLLKCNRGRVLPYSKWGYEHRVSEPSFYVFPTNGVGTLFPPGSLHHDVINQDLFMKLCPSADDVWLKAMPLRNNVKCKVLGYRGVLSQYVQVPFDSHDTLFKKINIRMMRKLKMFLNIILKLLTC